MSRKKVEAEKWLGERVDLKMDLKEYITMAIILKGRFPKHRVLIAAGDKGKIVETILDYLAWDGEDESPDQKKEREAKDFEARLELILMGFHFLVERIEKARKKQLKERIGQTILDVKKKFKEDIDEKVKDLVISGLTTEKEEKVKGEPEKKPKKERKEEKKESEKEEQTGKKTWEFTHHSVGILKTDEKKESPTVSISPPPEKTKKERKEEKKNKKNVGKDEEKKKKKKKKKIQYCENTECLESDTKLLPKRKFCQYCFSSLAYCSHECKLTFDIDHEIECKEKFENCVKPCEIDEVD